MAREEVENTGEDMVIDGVETAQKQNYEVPDGFNANYLKIYYGDIYLLYFVMQSILLTSVLNIWWFNLCDIAYVIGSS